MGRWRISMKLALAALAASGGCVVLASCGGGSHTTPCSQNPIQAPSDASADSGGMGMLIIGGMVTNCPLPDSLTIQPNELDLGKGGMAVVTATAVTPDEGMPTFQWTASPGGVFADPGNPTTTFQCTVGGMITLTVTVTYDNCMNQLSGFITCLAVDGG
jgi:hypothetical protein